MIGNGKRIKHAHEEASAFCISQSGGARNEFEQIDQFRLFFHHGFYKMKKRSDSPRSLFAEIKSSLALIKDFVILAK